MRFFRNATHVVALEPMSELHAVIREEAEQWLPQHTTMDVVSLHLDEYLNQYPDQVGTFDWVILGNVLCEVPCVETTLRSVNQILKDEGQVYFSEHIGCKCSSWQRRLQNMLNPWWKTVSGGCNINRDSLDLIQAIPDWEVISWNFHTLRVGLGPFVLGLAQKKKR